MKNQLKRIILSIQFFTRIPIRVNMHCDEKDFGKSLVYAPITGLLIGVIIYGGYYFLSLMFPVHIASLFALVLYLMITGGIHVDGVADTFDGLLSGKDRDRTLEIMRDSRLGTYGAISIIILFALYVLFIPEVIPLSILLIPVSGKMASLITAGISTYARKGEGLGKSFIDYCGIREIITGVIFSYLIFYIFMGLKGIIVGFISGVSSLALTWILTHKIKGATGDILGAVCELNQSIFLIVVYFLLK